MVRITTVLVLFVLVQGTPAVMAATVWSDNFDDGDYDDWTVVAGSVSATEHNLRVTGSSYAVVYRNSTTVTGTWRFDLDMTDEPDNTQLCFITKNIDGNYVRDNYLVENNGDNDGFRLMRWIWTGSSMSPLVLDEYDVTGGITGWYHFDITRDGSGQMYIYINDTLAMQAVDTTHDVSSCFVLNVPIAPSGTGPAIDNVIVSDTVDITPPTTTTTEPTSSIPPPANTSGPGNDFLIFFGIGIISLVIVRKRKK
ncbi:MAG: hypothetical protein ACFFD4_13420 [Candidatus Odinarchaeota archaeon]